VVIVCLSNNSVTKEGYVQRELRFVLQIADYKPDGTIFVIPVRLDDCPLPRRLKIWQYIDFFPKDRMDWAYQRLFGSLQMRAENLGLSPKESGKAEQEAKERATLENERRKIALSRRAEPAEVEVEGLRELEAKAAAKPKEVARRQAKQPPHKPQEVSATPQTLWKPFETLDTRLLALGGVILLGLLFWGISALLNREPAAPPPEQSTATVTITPTAPTRTPTATQNPSTPTITPTPTPGIGSTMISEKDGMVMVFVPEGEFTMGSDTGSADERPVHQVYLDAFWIDQTEVTNSMYAKCVADDGCTPPSSSKSSTRSNYYGNSEFDDYPVIYVNRSQANAYCAWAGRRLPTEAEWEKAARGIDGRAYPWGEGISCDNANYYAGRHCVGDTSKVRSYESGKSPYGAYDMAGNVWEWVNDWYDEKYYQISPLLNPQGPISGQYRVLRGGSWYVSGGDVRSANRYRIDRTYTLNYIGFRCSLSP